MSECLIDFYRGRDEEQFLNKWQELNGKLTDEQIDDLYEAIADDIDKAVAEGTHKLGEVYHYHGVEVGRSDYNQAEKLYLFEQ